MAILCYCTYRESTRLPSATDKEFDMSTQQNVPALGRSLWSLCGLLFFGSVTYHLFLKHICPGLSEIITIDPKTVTLPHLGLIFAPLIGYLLIAGNICLAVNVVKPLKAWDDRGLVWHLTIGFAMGLGACLICSFVFGALGGAVEELTYGLVGGLLGSSLAGFGVSLFGGLFGGIFKELAP